MKNCHECQWFSGTRYECYKHGHIRMPQQAIECKDFKSDHYYLKNIIVPIITILTPFVIISIVLFNI